MRQTGTKKWRWAASVAVTALWCGAAASAYAGTLQHFTVQNALDPTKAGGVMSPNVAYWGTFTVDTDQYAAFRSGTILPDTVFTADLFIGPTSIDDITAGFLHPVPVAVPAHEFANLPMDAQIFHLLAPSLNGRFAGIDQVELTVRDFLEVPATATTPHYFVRTSLTLVFLEPVHLGNRAPFLGGPVDYAFYGLEVFDDTFSIVDTNGGAGADTTFSAIAIDPLVVPVASPEPSTALGMALALGLYATLRRRLRMQGAAGQVAV